MMTFKVLAKTRKVNWRMYSNKKKKKRLTYVTENASEINRLWSDVANKTTNCTTMLKQKEGCKQLF